MSIPVGDRALAWERVEAVGRVRVPEEVGVRPGDRLLAVRGSGWALGVLAQGPIFAEALRHPELGELVNHPLTIP